MKFLALGKMEVLFKSFHCSLLNLYLFVADVSEWGPP